MINIFQMQTVSLLNWGFFHFFRIQRFQVLKVFKCEMMHRVDPTVTSGVTITSLSVCSPIPWNHLQTASHPAAVCMKNIFIFYVVFFFKSASVLLSSPNRVTAVTQPQHHLSFSTVMLQDVTDAAGRLFKHPVKRLFVLHQSFKLTRSYSRFPPVLMAAVATDITPVSPQEWIDLGTPATLSAA